MHRIFLVISVLSCISACARPGGDGPLAGEWRIRFDSLAALTPPGTPTPVRLMGAVVFDRRIDRYGYEDGTLLPRGAVLGRAYLPMHADGTLMPATPEIPFKHGPDADVQEETAAVLSETGDVILSLAPKLSHFGLELHGKLSGDTVRGSWAWSRARATPARGPFTMWRVGRSSLTDSAIVRSRRGARLWRSDKQL